MNELQQMHFNKDTFAKFYSGMELRLMRNEKLNHIYIYNSNRMIYFGAIIHFIKSFSSESWPENQFPSIMKIRQWK